MAKILVQLNSGPEHQTKVAIAFLVAKTAQQEGHDTSIFLTGDATQALRDAVIDNLAGLGVGTLKEHFDAFVKAGGRVFASGLSAKGRGVGEGDVIGKPVEFVPPTKLVALTLEADRTITF